MDPDVPPADRLQHLLALKHHEVPPPGFFEAFPERVRARIRAAGSTSATPWWERVRSWTGWRPALAGACVVVACGLWLWPRVQGPEAGPGRRAGGSGVPAGQGGLVEGATATAPATPWPAQAPVRRAEAVNSMAPQGLFTPGLGLRGALSPAAATTGVQGLVATGLPPATLPPTR